MFIFYASCFDASTVILTTIAILVIINISMITVVFRNV